jgi:hypothetical protein
MSLTYLLDALRARVQSEPCGEVTRNVALDGTGQGLEQNRRCNSEPSSSETLLWRERASTATTSSTLA